MRVTTGKRGKNQEVTLKFLEKYLLEIPTVSRTKSNICFPALETVPSVLTKSFGNLPFSKIPGSVNSICTQMANHSNLPAVQESLYQADKINPTPVTDECLVVVIAREGNRLSYGLIAVILKSLFYVFFDHFSCKK